MLTVHIYQAVLYLVPDGNILRQLHFHAGFQLQFLSSTEIFFCPLFERCPRPACLIPVVMHIWSPTGLVYDVVMAEHVHGRDAQVMAEPGNQPRTCVLCLFREVPFLILCAGRIPITLAAHLNADGIAVPSFWGLLGVISCRAYRPGHGIQAAPLVNRPVPVNVEVRPASVRCQVVRLSRYPQVMDGDIFFPAAPAGDVPGADSVNDFMCHMALLSRCIFAVLKTLPISEWCCFADTLVVSYTFMLCCFRCHTQSGNGGSVFIDRVCYFLFIPVMVNVACHYITKWLSPSRFRQAHGTPDTSPRNSHKHRTGCSPASCICHGIR